MISLNLSSIILSCVRIQSFALVNVANTKASLYGYAELNMIYDVDANLGPLLVPQAIALDGANVAEGHFQADASESRLGFSGSLPFRVESVAS